MWVSELQAASMGKNSQDHKYLYMLIMFLQVHGHDKNHWFEIQNSIKINGLQSKRGTCTSPCHECCSSLAGLTWLPLCQSKKANQWFEFCLHGHFWLAYVTYMISCLPWKFLATTCKCTSINPWCCFHIFVVLKEKMEVKSMISKLKT